MLLALYSLLWSAAVLVGLTLTPLPFAEADAFYKNANLSRQLSDFLQKDNKLPLVNAEVLEDQDRHRKVVLYGFVESADQKVTAELRAAQFLGDPGIDVFNQIQVRPQLRELGQRQTANEPKAAASPQATDSGTTQATPNDIEAYLSQFQNEAVGYGLGTFAPVVPMFGLGALMMPPLFFGAPIFATVPSVPTAAAPAPAAPAPAISSPTGSGLVSTSPTIVNRPPSFVGKGPGLIGGGVFGNPNGGSLGSLGNRPGGQFGPFSGRFRPVPGFGGRR